VRLTRRLASWASHINELIGKAKKRSAELLWMCGKDGGMRPRTALTLWKSIIRPKLEYAAELFAGEVSLDLTKKVERVQVGFGRHVLGLGPGASDAFIRSELGLERMEARWAKLRLGYWRRLFSADPTRLIVHVALTRHSRARLHAVRGYMRSASSMLAYYDLQQYWNNPLLVAGEGKRPWKWAVGYRVDEDENQLRSHRMHGLKLLTDYMHIKDWNHMDAERAVFKAEVGRRGSLVSERYLDGRYCLLGSRIKLLCRGNCLPVMDRVGREQQHPWPPSARVCPSCPGARVESVRHFVLDCELYRAERTIMWDHIEAAMRSHGLDFEAFACCEEDDKFYALMGARIGHAPAENDIDFIVKKFLAKAWNRRKSITVAVNNLTGRND
jgi:hypothetical protein